MTTDKQLRDICTLIAAKVQLELARDQHGFECQETIKKLKALSEEHIARARYEGDVPTCINCGPFPSTTIGGQCRFCGSFLIHHQHCVRNTNEE